MKSDLFIPGPTDLADPRLGSRVVYASDEFFGAKERLIARAEPVFHPGRYDAHGKWMDGWETRRRRSAGNDFCIIRLGRPGLVTGFLIDTAYFTGNYPPAASIELCNSSEEAPAEDESWRRAVGPFALEGDAQKELTLPEPAPASHVRLNIFPDGGVARLRVFGRIQTQTPAERAAGAADLAAMEHGGRVLAANDAHFGHPANLIAPGPSESMADGWETRRRREPGFDWAIIALAAPGTVEEILIDTTHFKGNAPAAAYLQAAEVAAMPLAALIAQSQFWPELLGERRLEADAEHRFRDSINDFGPVSHVRLNIIPDGGVSRLRLFGRFAD